MVRHRNRKPKEVFSSKADTLEMREYQRAVSKYPPLPHERIIELSNTFIEGRNAEITLQEQKLVDSILQGDWTEENIANLEEKIIKSYKRHIDWISESVTSAELIAALVIKFGGSPERVHDNRNSNILYNMPWIQPISFNDLINIDGVTPKAFANNWSRFAFQAANNLTNIMPHEVPKDIIMRWEERLKEIKAHYMVNIQQLNLDEKEQRKQKRLIEKSKNALDDMVNHNLQLAMSRVSKILKNNPQASKIGIQDIINTANIGLVLGARQFDPNQGKRFSTYVTFHIDGQLYNLIKTENGKSGIQEMTPHEQKQLSQIMNLKKQFVNIVGREANLLELQSLSGISAKVIEQRLTTPKVVTQNIYSPVSPSEDSDNRVLADTIPADTDIETTISHDTFHEMVNFMMNEIDSLPEIQKTIVAMRIGLVLADGTSEKKPKTVRRIAGELGLTMNEVNKMYTDALNLIKTKMSVHGYSEQNIPEDL